MAESTQQAATLVSPDGTAKACLLSPAARTREATKTFSIGLADSSRMAAGRSLRFSTPH